MKRSVLVLFALLLTAACVSVPARASEAALLVDSRQLSFGAELVGGSAFVPARRFCAELGIGIEWDGESRSVFLSGDGVSAVFRDKSVSFYCGGSEKNGAAACFIRDGTFYIPARSAAEAMKKSVIWDGKGRRVLFGSGNSYGADELYWLSRIISAESAGECFEGKIAVGNVVLNRVKSPDFPDTVYGVIFDRAFGVQFTPVANGTVFAEPTEESVLAARRCLDGENNVGDCLYFFNPAISDKQGWIVENRAFCRKIGNHDFYR